MLHSLKSRACSRPALLSRPSWYGQRCRQQAELRCVTGALDCTTLRVAHNHGQPGPGQPGREFKTAENIVIDKITRDACHEKITGLLV